ncbi:MAG: beta-N-acetylhexosaminidase [Eubacteriales bacterium]|nr:beta-N-acetylhexosaminidase [Eubacteriales bacterium]
MRLFNQLLHGVESGTWQRHFKSSGVMLDCSRNSVLTAERLEWIFRKMARMGLNFAMLYTEDTYEIPEYPYFSYFRGVYSADEIRRIDRYAAALGIELVPCIQTLGHLEKALRWPFAEKLRDTDAVLLCEDEASFDFIRAMIDRSSELFSTRRIHLGMDEAFGVGLGRYLQIHGYQKMRPILQAHMERVYNYCKDKGLVPMIWSDMPFRAASPEGIYWVGSETVEDFAERAAGLVPDGLELVYWDYYHQHEEDYEAMLRRHFGFKSPILFAGGAWTWNGIAPNLRKARQSTDVQMRACLKLGIEEVFCTCWQDNGAETSLITILPTLQRYAQYLYYGADFDEASLADEFQANCDISYDDFMLLGDFDQLPLVDEDNIECVNPSKYLLYQDPKLPFFDNLVEAHAGQIQQHYLDLESKLRAVKVENEDYRPLFDFYVQLAACLKQKACLSHEIRKAYRASERDSLVKFEETIIPRLIDSLSQLKASARILWYASSKPMGFESFDIRLSALIGRLQTLIMDIHAYLAGDEATMQEFDLTLRDYRGREADAALKQINENQWHKIAAPNPIF